MPSYVSGILKLEPVCSTCVVCVLVQGALPKGRRRGESMWGLHLTIGKDTFGKNGT